MTENPDEDEDQVGIVGPALLSSASVEEYKDESLSEDNVLRTSTSLEHETKPPNEWNGVDISKSMSDLSQIGQAVERPLGVEAGHESDCHGALLKVTDCVCPPQPEAGCTQEVELVDVDGSKSPSGLIDSDFQTLSPSGSGCTSSECDTTDSEAEETAADRHRHYIRRFPTKAFPDRYIEIVDEVCENYQSFCDAWKEYAVKEAVKNAQSEMQYTIDQLEKRLSGAEKQNHERDCLLGAKVLACKKLERELEKVTSCNGLDISHDEFPKKRPLTATTSLENWTTAKSTREEELAANVAELREEKERLSTKLQLNEMLLVTQADRIAELEKETAALQRNVEDSEAALTDLRASVSSHEYLEDSIVERRPSLVTLDGSEDLLLDSPSERQPSDSDVCVDCVALRKLQQEELLKLLEELTSILSVYQDGQADDCEVLVAQLHCKTASKLANLKDFNNAPFSQWYDLRPQTIFSLRRGSSCSQVDADTNTQCANCQRLHKSLSEIRQKFFLEAICNKDSSIAIEERRLTQQERQQSSALLTLRREKEELVLQLKQLAARHVVLSSSSDTSCSSYADISKQSLSEHQLRNATPEELTTALTTVRSKQESLLSSIKSGLELTAMVKGAKRVSCSQDCLQLLATLCAEEADLQNLEAMSRRCFGAL